MKKLSLLLVLAFLGTISFAQKTTKNQQYFDFATTFGKGQTSLAASYVYDWKLGKKKKFAIGIGGRLTSTFGTNNQFFTAGPANLTRGTSVPFVIMFSKQKIQNIDTLTVSSPSTTALNFTINLSYNLSSKLTAGFNIDAIGFTFGKKSSGVLVTNGNAQIESVAKPSSFNLLLTSDNDLGTLNSEFFVKYKLNNRWGVRAVFQHLFTEYKTTTIKQTAPDGTKVDRFRNINNNIGLGISYAL